MSTPSPERVKELFHQAMGLPPEARFQIEARAATVGGDHAAAVKAYRKLWDYFPAELDYALGLAQAQLDSGATEDAAATLSELPPP